MPSALYRSVEYRVRGKDSLDAQSRTMVSRASSYEQTIDDPVFKSPSYRQSRPLKELHVKS